MELQNPDVFNQLYENHYCKLGELSNPDYTVNINIDELFIDLNLDNPEEDVSPIPSSTNKIQFSFDKVGLDIPENNLDIFDNTSETGKIHREFINEHACLDLTRADDLTSSGDTVTPTGTQLNDLSYTCDEGYMKSEVF